MSDDNSEAASVTLYLGDEKWHDGPGWYYVIDDYPDEGSCGAFKTRAEATEHAQACGYFVSAAAIVNGYSLTAWRPHEPCKERP